MADRLELLDVSSPRVREIWRDLEAAARPPYFLTWGWIENWLAMLPVGELPQLAVVHDDGGVAGACFLGRRRQVRHRVLPSEGLFLNTTGLPHRDDLTIEHNGVLARPGAPWPLARLVTALTQDEAWDELFLPACCPELAHDLAVPAGFRVLREREVPSPYIELARVRTAGDYLAVVSANTRAQIRRAHRRAGRYEVELASDVPSALAIFDKLVELHTATWTARGEPGAFADPWIRHFHRRLIEQRFGHGEIQLVRLHADGVALGCCYNLVANGRVLFYQSGLAELDDPVVKPGYLVHAAAIEHSAKAGHDVYDLLAGEARYKSSLATAAIPLTWLRVQRQRKRFRLEDRLRDARDRYVDMRSRARATSLHERVAKALDRAGAIATTLRVKRSAPVPTLAIFTFHRVDDVRPTDPFDPDIVDATPAQFRRRVEMLARAGTPIGMDTLADAIDGRGALPPNPVMITFDDGYRSCRDVALPILREVGVPATFFIATDFMRAQKLYWWEQIAVMLARTRRRVVELVYPQPIRFDASAPTARRILDDVVKNTRELDLGRFLDELRTVLRVPWSPDVECELANQLIMTWDDVHALARAGMSVESHSRTHRVLDTLDDAALASELTGSRSDLEAHLGRPVHAIAYPVGRRPSARVVRAVAAAGYRLGFTNATGVNRMWPRWARKVDQLDLHRLSTERSHSDALFLAQLALPVLSYRA